MSFANSNFKTSQKSSGLSSSIFTQFLITQSSYCLINGQTKYFCKTFFIDKNFWFKNFALTKLHSSAPLTYLVDGCQSRATSDFWSLSYNTNNMLSDERNLFLSNVAISSFYTPSISNLFPSAIWLERELSDFTGLNFLGLVDTRRLLLDYFEEKKVWSTHISNDKNFNNILYDITLAY